MNFILAKVPKVGMRSIKTVIATFLSIIISNALGFESPFFATLSAFLCIQGSILESSQMAVNRSIGTIIGGVFSLIYVLFLPSNIYLIPLGLLVIIYLYNLFDKSDMITISCVVFLAMSFNTNIGQEFNPVTYVIDRVGETTIGILIAVIINYYIKPPSCMNKLKLLNEAMTEFVKINFDNEENILKVEDIDKYRSDIHEFDSLVQNYYKEVNVKKYDFSIKYYEKQLLLFKSAYSHIFILNSEEGIDANLQKYHMGKLSAIREELTKHD